MIKMRIWTKNDQFLPPKGLHVERIIHYELHPAGAEHLEHGGVIITPVSIEIFIFVSVYDVPIQNQSGVSFIIQHLNVVRHLARSATENGIKACFC